MPKRPSLRKIRMGNEVSGTKRTKLSQKPMNLDENISSGDESENSQIVQDDDGSEDSEFERETAEEKRQRLAKQYIADIKKTLGRDADDASNADDDDEIDEEESTDHIGETLKTKRLQAKRKLYHSYASQFSNLKVSDLNYSHYYGHSGPVTALALSSDDKTLFTGSKDNSLLRFDIETGQKAVLKRRWSRDLDVGKQSSEGEVLAVAVTTDSRYVVCGGRDNVIRIFDERCKAESAEVQVFKGHSGAVTGLAFKYDSYALYSTSLDRCVKHWDLTEMGYLETMFGHQVGILIK